MNIRDIFRLILKVLGVLMIKDVFFQILSMVTFLTSLEEDWIEGLLMLVIIGGALLTVAYMLLFKTDLIIDKLKLDHHFTSINPFANKETVDNVNLKPLITLALLFAGIYLLATEIPNFLRQLYSWYQTRRLDMLSSEKIFPYVILSGTKIIIAYILINACNPISSFIERKRSKVRDNA